MSYMFYGCKSLIFFPDITKWNISNLIDMNSQFSYCESLLFFLKNDNNKYKKLDNLKVEDISNLFSGCKSLTSLPDISNLKTENVTDMNSMFKGCYSLISLPDISKWDTRYVTNMSGMFNECFSLTSLPDIGKWNIERVTNKNQMFNKCFSLVSFPEKFIMNSSNNQNINFINK